MANHGHENNNNNNNNNNNSCTIIKGERDVDVVKYDNGVEVRHNQNGRLTGKNERSKGENGNNYCYIINNNNIKLSKFITNKALIFLIINALLIQCIISVESSDRSYYSARHPRIYDLMTQQINLLRYNNGSSNNSTMDGNSSQSRISSDRPIFREYVKGGEKVKRLKEHIKNVLVPRVSGTQGNIDVRNYIVQTLLKLGFKVKVDIFKDKTPFGEVIFGNVIADSNPKACKQLVLACHYDSKMMEGFLGATDSAVPCAILLETARTLKDNNFVDPAVPKSIDGVRFVFFDGEEAFAEWTNTDSLYGSRNLASKWSKQAMPKECGSGTELRRISLFVLLDLIGSTDTKIPRYFHAKSYYKLMTLERQYLSEFNESKKDMIFNGNYNFHMLGVQDDHIPFHSRSVPTLLLLSAPFPSVWHTLDDNNDCIDYVKTVRTLAVIDRFTIDYLNGNRDF